MKGHSLWSVLMLAWLSASNTPVPTGARNAPNISLSERESDGEAVAGPDLGAWKEKAGSLDEDARSSALRKAAR